MRYGHLQTFKNNNINFVKPLYRKVKFRKCRPQNVVEVPTNLDGEDASVSVKKLYEINKKIRINKCVAKRHRAYKPMIDNFVGDGRVKDNNYERKYLNEGKRELGDKMLNVNENDVTINSDDRHMKRTQTEKKIHKGDNWLRVYPASKRDEKSISSMIFRCTICQLGLAALLVLWNILWLFVINSFEEPFETMVTEQFEKEQNQLVIDLATELRQITPISPKWRQAIEHRIEDERQLTVAAVGRGAKLHPGQFWDLSGTYLFTVYVMTALGFGAPVPQTIWGRTSALIYAFFGVPTHIYLNSPVINKNVVLNKRSSSNLRKKFLYIIRIISAGRCVPLVTCLYYTCGALTFGLARQKAALESIMFPLEFTTTGGLDQTEDYVRILYGFYIEGASYLLACAVATLRRHSTNAVTNIADKYNLFQDEDDLV